MSVVAEIERLKHERDAVILAHNYQPREVQDAADYTGDSLGLSRKAAELPQSVIVFCGVDFMAETAKILSPLKTVLMPRPEATCPMAAMVGPGDIETMRAEHPGAPVVSYVNTTAAVKAASDVCCTSSNAVEIVRSLDGDEVIFVPDRNLADWVRTRTGKTVHAWDGWCYVHRKFDAGEVSRAKRERRGAVLMVHPECDPDVVALADEVLSTGGMLRFARGSDAEEFLVATEEGLLHRLKKENPSKRFWSAGRAQVCRNMKLTALEDVLRALREMEHEVALPAETVERARGPIEEMVKYA